MATFSILGYDPATGEVGGAVQSRVFTVGNGVLWAEAGVGAAATQAIVDVSYGPKAIALLRAGMGPRRSSRRSGTAIPIRSPERWTKQGRQFAVIDQQGNTAVFTGPKATTWAGHQQGQVLHGAGQHPRRRGRRGRHGAGVRRDAGHLSMRLTAALEAGQAAGGDTRGMQSAAILIVGKGQGVWLNNDVVMRLQVDDSPEPIKELRRLVDSWNERRAKGQQQPAKVPPPQVARLRH